MNPKNEKSIKIEDGKKNYVSILKGLTTGQMISQLKTWFKAECFYSRNEEEYVLVIQKRPTGAIIIMECDENADIVGHELVLSAEIMSHTWNISACYVTFYEAMRVHQEEKKTVTYHHTDELKYEFKHELETGQFKSLYNDSLCLYELIGGKWTIDD